MTVIAIAVVDQFNPTELNTWFSNNSLAQIFSISNNGNIFYIFYT